MPYKHAHQTRATINLLLKVVKEKSLQLVSQKKLQKRKEKKNLSPIPMEKWTKKNQPRWCNQKGMVGKSKKGGKIDKATPQSLERHMAPGGSAGNK